MAPFGAKVLCRPFYEGSENRVIAVTAMKKMATTAKTMITSGNHEVMVPFRGPRGVAVRLLVVAVVFGAFGPDGGPKGREEAEC